MAYTLAHPDGGWRFDVYTGAAIDGDTARIVADLGFGVRFEFDLRLADVYAPELNEVGGPEARQVLATLLAERVMVVTTYRKASGTWERSFARWVGRLAMMTPDGLQDVGAWLVEQGYAKRENG